MTGYDVVILFLSAVCIVQGVCIDYMERSNNRLHNDYLDLHNNYLRLHDAYINARNQAK